MTKLFQRLNLQCKLPLLCVLMLFYCGVYAGNIASKPRDAQETYQTRNGGDTEGIVLLLKNGITVCFNLSDNPVVITSDKLIVRTSHEELIYDYSNVKYVFWDYVDITSVNNIQRSTDIKFYLKENSIEVSGLATDEYLWLYSIDGVLLEKVAGQTTYNITLNLPTNKATYIIRTSSGIRYKFINK